jgi:two-component system cell cycle sensor histidine kinase/response regulator CckA
LLAFGRKQVLEPEPTDLNSVVEETFVLAGRLLTEDIELVSRLEAESATIMIDRNQLQQVILNLCVNARDAMPSGGRLSVHTATAELDDAYAASRLDVTPGRYALLEITDSGVGMDAPTAGRVFEPFFTTKQTGSGLGLASVHGIVKQSGGHISVYSEPGIGTTFRLYLPQTGAAVRRTAEAPRSHELEGEETILLVEDAEPLRLLVADTLESYGYTVRTAANGAEALDLAHREGSMIDLLLTDVVMPQMSGRELAEHITSSHPHVKVLFTSGYPADTVLAERITDGRFAYVQKPYLGDTLARKIRETLNADRAATS